LTASPLLLPLSSTVPLRLYLVISHELIDRADVVHSVIPKKLIDMGFHMSSLLMLLLIGLLRLELKVMFVFDFSLFLLDIFCFDESFTQRLNFAY